MSRKNVRVVIPKNADELIALGEGIEAKHTADGAGSPLNGLDMDTFSTKLAAAKVKNDQQKQLHRDAEMATEERDDLLGKKKDQNTTTDGTVLNIISRTRDMLLGLYKGNEQQLGQWGFDVNQSATGGSDGGSAPPPPPTGLGAINLSVTDQVTFNGIGGAFAEVVGTGVSGTTDPSGNLLVSNVPVGSQQLRVSAPSYDVAETSITITDGRTVNVGVQLNSMP